MTYAKRTDSTQREIVDALRKLGYAVVDLSRVGGGVPDLLVAAGASDVFLVECKAPKGTLRASQEAFRRRWPGQVEVWRSAEDVLRAHGERIA